MAMGLEQFHSAFKGATVGCARNGTHCRRNRGTGDTSAVTPPWSLVTLVLPLGGLWRGCFLRVDWLRIFSAPFLSFSASAWWAPSGRLFLATVVLVALAENALSLKRRPEFQSSER